MDNTQNANVEPSKGTDVTAESDAVETQVEDTSVEETTKENELIGPVFVVGNGRSGTSVMLSTVRKTLGWKYHGEGHFYPLLKPLMVASDRYFRMPKIKRLSQNDGHLVAHMTSQQVKRRLEALIGELIVEHYGTTQFVDKTPGPEAMVVLPFLQRPFPGMRVIHMKRRGIEVTRSAVKKFSNVPFERHVKLWSNALTNWEKIEPKLTVPHLTIDQYRLETQTRDVVDELAEFLSLSDEQAEAMYDYFTTDRPQSSGQLNDGGVSLETSGWTDEEVESFRRIASDHMEAHGWSETESYFRDAE